MGRDSGQFSELKMVLGAEFEKDPENGHTCSVYFDLERCAVYDDHHFACGLNRDVVQVLPTPLVEFIDETRGARDWLRRINVWTPESRRIEKTAMAVQVAAKLRLLRRRTEKKVEFPPLRADFDYRSL